MTDAAGPDRTDPVTPQPSVAADETDETSTTTRSDHPSPHWQPDAYRGPTALRPVAARRVRRGCWLLVVVLLLICCVLSAWLTDSILDLRAITTGS